VQWVERGGTTVFDYSNLGSSDSAGQFAGGFLVAIGMSFATMVGIGVSSQAGRGLPFTVAATSAVVFVYIAIRAAGDPWRASFFKGLMTGIVLGAIGFGPCSVMALFQ
jgi:hypothetical protein